MFEITRYTADRKAEWDAFIDSSRNGTFLLKRGYMDYHSDRFDDHSLMFHTKNRLYAVLPADVKDGTLYSHRGLTYGGLITGDNVKAADTCTLFAEMNAYLKTCGIGKVVYKAIPWIYHRLPAEEDLYAIYRVCGARLLSRDISSTIILTERPAFSQLRRRCCRKAERYGVTVRESEDIDAFWQILDRNLENKYGVKPVHTCQELRLLMSRFPRNIRLYMAFQDEKPLGGALLFINRGTVHSQYISASPEGKRTGALDMLFNELISKAADGFQYFDFGKSTEQGGAYLNENLIRQKEGFGGRGVCYDTYEWKIV